MRTMIAIVAGAITLVGAPSATAVSSYTATPAVHALSTYSQGYGINSLGHITGDSRTPALQAFIFADGVMQHFGLQGQGTLRYSLGRAVNDHGEVAVNEFHCTFGCRLYAIRYSNGMMHYLFPLSLYGTGSSGLGINSSGHVVGEAFGPPYYAFVHTGSALTRLGTLGGTASRGRAINDAGQVTGAAAIAGDVAEHAFLYSGLAMLDLGTLGGTNSIGNAINAAGQVAGASDLPGNAAQHAFLWSGGTMLDLGTLGGTDSFAYGVNASGQAVGTASTPGNASNRAFLYERGRMYDLNALVISGLGSDPLTGARGINNAGQIVANACGSQGCQAYLLTPAGELREATEVPALSHVALIALAALLGAAGLFRQAKS